MKLTPESVTKIYINSHIRSVDGNQIIGPLWVQCRHDCNDQHYCEVFFDVLRILFCIIFKNVGLSYDFKLKHVYQLTWGTNQTIW